MVAMDLSRIKDTVSKAADLQNSKPSISLPLRRVGVSKVKTAVKAKLQEDHVLLPVTVDIFLDLPENLRGAHLSRCIEALQQSVETLSQSSPLVELAVQTAKRLLQGNQYATRSEVHIYSSHPFPRKAVLSGKAFTELLEAYAAAIVTRDQGGRKIIGATFTVMLVCPCTMELAKTFLEVSPPSIPSHTQRTLLTLAVSTDLEEQVTINDLIEIVEDSSHPAKSLLKRPDEIYEVLSAYQEPLFVEDLVRKILLKASTKLFSLPEDTVVHISAESLESVHPFNIKVEGSYTLRELHLLLD